MSRDAALRALWQKKLPSALKNISSGIIVLVLVVGGFWGSHLFEPGHSESGLPPEATAPDSPIPMEVTLPPEKVESAGIHLCEVNYADIQRTKTVAALVDYDSTRHLSVKAPVECVVQRWFVQPGQYVNAGATLAVLSGTEVAMARAEIRKCEADVRIAQINFDWSQETQANLTELLATLKQQPSVEVVQAQFGGKRLGEHRDHLLKTYTQYVLASSVAQRSQPLGQQGIIAGRTVEARLGDRDVAATMFKSACEQSEFEGEQQLAKSRAELDLANQKLEIAKDRLKMLLGPLAHKTSDGAPGDFEIRAPFDGRVEVLHASPASRLMQGDAVLTFADTTKLWVSALIHQHDWQALQVPARETVQVTLPAIPDKQFSAQVSFVGPEVSPTTRAISLIAELDNQDGRFRPGMFAWVELPMESPRRSLVVPPSAVQRHESETFVFVQVGENRFRRVDVTLGSESSDYLEVEQGLSAGQMVVDQGSFYLKSELLLEQEGD